MKDQSEPQPPSDDSNGEETGCIPPLFMALLHPEAYPQSVFIKALRPLWVSSTYQAILEEGRAEVRAEEARRILKRLGTRRFGIPDAEVDSAIHALTDLAVLEGMIDQIAEASNWNQLLTRLRLRPTSL